MADVKHTPGPWFVDQYEDEESRHVITSKPDHLYVAYTIGGLGKEQEANADLIAAAPDLLEALRAFVSPWDGDSVEEIESQSGLATSVRIEQARAAIAKATVGAARATEGSAT